MGAPSEPYIVVAKRGPVARCKSPFCPPLHLYFIKKNLKTRLHEYSSQSNCAANLIYKQ